MVERNPLDNVIHESCMKTRKLVGKTANVGIEGVVPLCSIFAWATKVFGIKKEFYKF